MVFKDISHLFDGVWALSSQKQWMNAREAGKVFFFFFFFCLHWLGWIHEWSQGGEGAHSTRVWASSRIDESSVGVGFLMRGWWMVVGIGMGNVVYLAVIRETWQPAHLARGLWRCHVNTSHRAERTEHHK